jgi:hypothetical protein
VRAISFPSSSTGFIISAGGKINKTVNTYSWTALTSGTTNDLNDIYFTDVNKGYVVGNSGTLLRTLNSGTTWQQASIGTSVNLNAIYFLSSDTGYVVGDLGTVLLTVNGGNLWSIVPLGLKDDLFSVHFNNGIGCIAGRNNLILKMEYNTSLPTLPPVVTSLKSTGLTEQDLNVFPNPSSGSVSLSFSSGYYSEKISYSLINEMGIEIESGEPEKNGQEYKINLQHHPKGMYFLKLISNETFGVEKIIIQ